MKQQFKTLDSQAEWPMTDGKQTWWNVVNATTALAYLSISRSRHPAGYTGRECFPHWGDAAVDPDQGRQSLQDRRGRSTEKGLWWSSSSIHRVLPAHSREETTPHWGKTWEQSRCFYRAGDTPVPNRHTGKPPNSRSIRESTQVLPRGRIISPRMNTALILPNKL